MKDIYEEMMAASRVIAASFPQPRFYVRCGESLNLSRSLYDEDAQVMKCRSLVLSELKDELGHGIEHSGKVALEAGALDSQVSGGNGRNLLDQRNLPHGDGEDLWTRVHRAGASDWGENLPVSPGTVLQRTATRRTQLRRPEQTGRTCRARIGVEVRDQVVEIRKKADWRGDRLYFLNNLHRAFASRPNHFSKSFSYSPVSSIFDNFELTKSSHSLSPFLTPRP